MLIGLSTRMLIAHATCGKSRTAWTPPCDKPWTVPILPSGKLLTAWTPPCDKTWSDPTLSSGKLHTAWPPPCDKSWTDPTLPCGGFHTHPVSWLGNNLQSHAIYTQHLIKVSLTYLIYSLIQKKNIVKRYTYVHYGLFLSLKTELCPFPYEN